MESFHPITAFCNRAGSLNFLAPQQEPDTTFTHGTVIRVFDNERPPVLGGDAISHTTRLAKSFLVSKASSTSTLDGTTTEIITLFSTRDNFLHAWVMNAISTVLERSSSSATQEHCNEIRVILALTSVGLDEQTPCDAENSMQTTSTILCNESSSLKIDDTSHSSSTSNLAQEASNQPSRPSWTIEIMNHRLDYSREILNDSIVFCQGSAALKKIMRKVCVSKDAVRLNNVNCFHASPWPRTLMIMIIMVCSTILQPWKVLHGFKVFDIYFSSCVVN